jgi:tetratricopeptide (TPR) repeat protein
MTAFLRLGATMRVAGMKDEALAALERVIAMADKASDESTRDETRVELCRELTLLGKPDRARDLVTQIKARQYDLVAWLFIAQAALERGDPAEAERTVRDALNQIESSRRKPDRMGGSALCALSCLARSMNKPELARQCASLVNDPIWKSAMLGDEAESLAESGQAAEALRVATQAEDPHLAVLAHARAAAAMFRQKQSPADSVATILQTAAKTRSSDARDFALRMAARKFASAGDTETALKIVAEIKCPAMRLLAAMPSVNENSFQAMLADLQKCAGDEQPLLAEVLTVACGARGLTDQALGASALTVPGWPRVRALTDAMDRARGGGTTKLAGAAERELAHITDAGWRDRKSVV